MDSDDSDGDHGDHGAEGVRVLHAVVYHDPVCHLEGGYPVVCYLEAFHFREVYCPVVLSLVCPVCSLVVWFPVYRVCYLVVWLLVCPAAR
jgi:hypothetical protein